MVLVLIEGPDCSGKTTLAGHVVDVLRATYPRDVVTYYHAGPPEEHPLEEYVEPLLNYRPGVGYHVVCDRWHVGELVYPVVLGRPTDMTSSVRRYVEAFLRSRGAQLIYCDTSERHLLDCGVARQDDIDDLRRVGPTMREFERVIASSSLPLLTVDATIPIPDHLRTLALEVVGRGVHEAGRAEVLSSFTTYVGPPRPKLLLVGDRRGTPAHDLDEFGDWPAFVPLPGTSGRYLLDALTSVPPTVAEHGLTLADVGLVNANDVDDVRACWDALGHPSVVALGRNAQRRLTELDVPHRDATHPMYWKRFHFSERNRYRDSLLATSSVEVTA